MHVIQISDIHLSPTHAFFLENWRKAADFANAANPDLVIVSGDLAINGPDEEKEIAFAREELGRLKAPWKVFPGNHDVGDEPPGQDEKQLIDDDRLERWRRHFGQDWWLHHGDGWRIVGLDSQLFGSGLEQEAAQFAFLEQALEEAGDVAVFMHKPLYVDTIDEGASSKCIVPGPREKLAKLFSRGGVRVVATGHLHCYQHQKGTDFDQVWAPSTAFMIGSALGVEMTELLPRATHQLGIMEYRFEPGTWSADLVEMDGLEPLRLSDIKQNGKYEFIRDMPPFYPKEVA